MGFGWSNSSLFQSRRAQANRPKRFIEWVSEHSRFYQTDSCNAGFFQLEAEYPPKTTGHRFTAEGIPVCFVHGCALASPGVPKVALRRMPKVKDRAPIPPKPVN